MLTDWSTVLNLDQFFPLELQFHSWAVKWGYLSDQPAKISTSGRKFALQRRGELPVYASSMKQNAKEAANCSPRPTLPFPHCNIIPKVKLDTSHREQCPHSLASFVTTGSMFWPKGCKSKCGRQFPEPSVPFSSFIPSFILLPEMQRYAGEALTAILDSENRQEREKLEEGLVPKGFPAHGHQRVLDSLPMGFSWSEK